MERVTFRNSRNLTLVGNLHSAPSKSAIVLAHGFTSDKSSDGRFDRLGSALNAIGYNVLAFDFGGCGESDDDVLSIDHQVDDLKCAISFVQSAGSSRIGLHGHSLGELICLKSYSPAISAMVLSGAPTDAMRYHWGEYYSKEQLQELEHKGYLTTRDRTGVERRIGQQLFSDLEKIDQRELLNKIECPVLLIHGNNPADREELLLLERSQKGIRFLSPVSRLEVLDGADHSLRSHFERVNELAKGWFLRYVPFE
jgi:pimeloyl-ACP methyl ester carboxylesterase